MIPNPEDQANAALAHLLEAMQHLFGEKVGAEVQALFADPIALASAPATTIARFQDVLRGAGTNLEPTPENMKRFSAAGVALEHLKEAMRSGCEVPHSLVGVQTLEFLRASEAAVEASLFTSIVDSADEVGILSVMRPAITNSQLPMAARPWESAARDSSDAMSRAAECWYRPMLVAMLRLTMLRRGLQQPIQHELGALMRQCSELWCAYGGPVAVISNEIRFIRNSESHRDTEIDVRAETITFVNHPRHPKPVERLGPFDRSAFGTLVHGVFEHCLEMHRAFVAVTTQ